MNAKSLVGMSVFAIDAGKNLGSVERLLFSPQEMRVTAFVLAPRSGLMEEPGPQKVLAVEKVRAIGQDAITVESEADLDVTSDGELPKGVFTFDQVRKEKVITESGEQVGEVSSINFSETDFRLESLEVGRGFFSGSSLLDVVDVISVGEDVIVVRDSVMTGGEPQEYDEEERDITIA